MIWFGAAWLLFWLVIAPALVMRFYPPSEHEIGEPWKIGHG